MKTDNWFVESKYMKMSIPKPPLQAVAIGVIASLMMLAGPMFGDPNFPWLVGGAFLFLFIIFNNALCIFALKSRPYILGSIYSFMGLITLMGLLAYAISGRSIFAEKAENRTIFIILIMAYFSLLMLAFLIRNAADFLQSKDEKMYKQDK